MDAYEELIGTDNITIKALQCWYGREIAKYGVMVLAYLHGKKYKVLHYLVSLMSLEVKLKQKMDIVRDQDTKEDLKMMIERISMLKQTAIVNFNINIEEIKRVANEYGDDIIQIVDNSMLLSLMTSLMIFVVF